MPPLSVGSIFACVSVFAAMLLFLLFFVVFFYEFVVILRTVTTQPEGPGFHWQVDQGCLFALSVHVLVSKDIEIRLTGYSTLLIVVNDCPSLCWLCDGLGPCPGCTKKTTD